MLTVNKKREENIKQIPTQYNYNVKLNKRLNIMALNTLINRVLIIMLIVSNIILFNLYNSVKDNKEVQPVVIQTEVANADNNYNVPDLPLIEDIKVHK